MATENQGIMSLPQGGQEAAPQISLDDSYDAISGALQDIDPQSNGQIQQLMAQLTPMLDQLTDDQLDALINVLQMLHDLPPEQYKQKLQELVDSKQLLPGMLPEEYDPELLAVLGMVCLQARRERQMGNQRETKAQLPQPPAKMARGGIAEAARMVASQGRRGDTMLAHINKDEARLLKSRGGAGTINPKTGLPEYGFFGDLYDATVGKAVDAVKSVVQKVTSTTVGKVLATAALATFIGPAAFGTSGALGLGLQYGLASGAVSALSGGSLKDVLRAGATSFLTGALAPVVGGAAGSALGVTNAAGQAALGAGITGAGIAKLSGQSLQDAVRAGLTQGAIAGAVSLGNQLRAPLPQGGAPVVEGAARTVEDIQREIAQGGGMQSPTPTGAAPGAVSPMQWGGPDIPDWDRQSASFPSRFNPANPMAGAQPSPAMGNALLDTQNMAPVEDLRGVPVQRSPFAQVKGGISDLLQGNYSEGLQGIKGGVSDFYDKNLSPSGIKAAGVEQAQNTALAKYNADIAAGVPEKIAMARYDAGVAAGTPGFLSTYGPITAAGLGVAALAGGFKPTPAPRSALAEQLAGNPSQELINANPRRYIPQGLPGVQYDETGNIIGSRPWEPSTTVEDIRRPMPGTMSTFNPPTYVPPAYGLTQQPMGIPQPYNTASMYSNLMPPRYAAEGGIMEIEEPVRHMLFGGILNSIRDFVSPVSQSTAAVPAATAPAAVTPMNAPAAPAAPFVRAAPAPTLGIASANPNIQDMISRMYPSLYNQQFRQQLMAPVPRGRAQGLASLAEGGYPRRTGQISGPGTEKSDSIPAMLSDGEFVMTAKAVRGAGNGSRRAGAKKMYALMHQLERNASRG